jgi:hypothetical protein
VKAKGARQPGSGGPLSKIVAAVALIVATFAAGSASGAPGGGQLMGVASCAGSTCHGRAEGNGAVVRQDEIATWQEPSAASGAHSRAFAVLNTLRGRQIGATLGIDPTSASECLGCHATTGGTRAPQFQLSDGVGCESCHGAAGGWLPTHFTVGGSHGANVAAGMTPLERPSTRAKVCLDCHYGSDDSGQFVSHRIMAAGHPRLSFELDLFSALQQHHDADADYARRKGAPSSVRLWAVGQAEAVRRSLSLFRQPGLGTQGMFPEFYFYDCHSCHRQITDGPQRKLSFETNPGRPILFGTPPYNDENIIMLSAVARVLAPAQAGAFDSAVAGFHKAMGQGRGEAVAAAQKLEAAASSLENGLDGRGYGADEAFQVVAAIADKATAPRFTDYAGSAQAVMAVDTLLNAMVRENRVTVGAAAGIRASINRAYGAVESPESYNPGAFRVALGQAARSIGALR